MKHKPKNVTSFIKKRDLKIAKEILEKEIDLIVSADNDPDCDSIRANVRGGFVKTFEEIHGTRGEVRETDVFTANLRMLFD